MRRGKEGYWGMGIGRGTEIYTDATSNLNLYPPLLLTLRG